MRLTLSVSVSVSVRLMRVNNDEVEDEHRGVRVGDDEISLRIVFQYEEGYVILSFSVTYGVA